MHRASTENDQAGVDLGSATGGKRFDANGPFAFDQYASHCRIAQQGDPPAFKMTAKVSFYCTATTLVLDIRLNGETPI